MPYRSRNTFSEHLVPNYNNNNNNNNNTITTEESNHSHANSYIDFEQGCEYPEAYREYWEDRAKEKNQVVFECCWEGCITKYILHDKNLRVPGIPPLDVMEHFTEHCDPMNDRCLWRGCHWKRRGFQQWHNLHTHLMTHF